MENQDPNNNMNVDTNSNGNMESNNNINNEAQLVANANNENVNNNEKAKDETVLKTKKEGLKADTLTKKTKFKYRVEDSKGRKFGGFLDAYSQSEVIAYLQNDGYKVLKIEAQNSILNMQIGGMRLNHSELAFMLTQLSTYLKAGIPLIESIRILEK